MKVTRALSVYIIRDLAKFSGQTFKNSDRLTHGEAQRLTEWAQSNKALVDAYLNKSHSENGTMRLFASVVRHFQLDHPQELDGGPSAWPDPATAERAVPPNQFGLKTAEEAEALLAWAKTTPEYRDGYTDKGHTQHADYVGQTHELMQMVHPIAPADHGRSFDAAAGKPPAPAVAPEPADNGTGWRGLSEAQIRAAVDPHDRIRELQRHPAYLNGKHPEHTATVTAMTHAYREAYPEPAAETGGSDPATP